MSDTTALHTLRGSVTAMAALDVGSIADHELHELVVAVQRERDRLALAHARLLQAWVERGIWADNGSRSAAYRLARDTNGSVGGARREVGRAAELAAMPYVAAAVASGRLSLAHVELFIHARGDGRAYRFAADEAFLVDTCAALAFADAARALSYWCQRVDAEEGGRDAERHQDRVHVHAARAVDGSVVIDGVLDPTGGAAFLAELDRLTDDLGRADRRDGVVRTNRQRRAAALVEMARRSAARPADATAARPLFTVLLGDDTFRQLCELADGTVVNPGALVPWLDDSMIESILFDGASTVVSVSHRRTFTGALRRAIQVRDRRCRHRSGCDVPASRCDVDHVVPAAMGGITSQFNGRLLCATHNRHAHLREPDLAAAPHRPVDRLHELRVRLRWRNRHYFPDYDSDDDPDTDTDADADTDAAVDRGTGAPDDRRVGAGALSGRRSTSPAGGGR